jgi:methionine-rich copper-binding protein CopC
MNRAFVPGLIVPLLATSASAFAHAELESANPPPNATLRVTPSEVSITFGEEVDAGFSGIEVLDAKGNREDESAARSAPGDARILSVALKPLAPGIYKVVWHATSVDSHKTKGSYGFTVKP